MNSICPSRKRSSLLRCRAGLGVYATRGAALSSRRWPTGTCASGTAGEAGWGPTRPPRLAAERPAASPSLDPKRTGPGPHSAACTLQQVRACPSPRDGPQNPVALRDRSSPHPTPPPTPYPHPGSPEPRGRPRPAAGTRTGPEHPTRQTTQGARTGRWRSRRGAGSGDEAATQEGRPTSTPPRRAPRGPGPQR